jgi:AbrB family looped-hinge helix DNA binding protein
MVFYTTITSKGQITLPAPIRRELHIEPGQQLQVSLEDGKVSVEAPMSIEEIRAFARREMEKNGTWGRIPDRSGNDEGMIAHVKEKYGSQFGH